MRIGTLATLPILLFTAVSTAKCYPRGGRSTNKGVVVKALDVVCQMMDGVYNAEQSSEYKEKILPIPTSVFLSGWGPHLNARSSY